MQIVTLDTDGFARTRDFPKDDSLAILQNAVGGYVEVVSLTIPGFGPVDMWLNEDGKGEELPPNDLATLIARDFIFPGDFIAGNVAFTRGIDDEGDTVAFSEQEANLLRDLLDYLV